MWKLEGRKHRPALDSQHYRQTCYLGRKYIIPMTYRKTLLTLMVTMLAGLSGLRAQEFHISKSDVFDEPGTGWTRILQLRNGVTFMLHIDMNNYGSGLDGTDITVFDKDRKIVKSEKLVCTACTRDKMRPGFIKGFYEINGEPVLFIVGEDEERTTLYRVRLDPANGSVVKEDILDTLNDNTRSRRYAFVLEDIAGMNIAKDPASDCYAVTVMNWDPENHYQSLKVMHFDGTHTKIGEASYDPKTQKFKHLLVNSAIVNGNKSVFVLCRGKKDKMSQSQGSDYFLMMKLKAGDKELTLKSVDLKEEKELNGMRSQMLYDKASDRVRVFAVWIDEMKYNKQLQKQVTYYLSAMMGFDAETLGLTYFKPLVAEKASAYARAHIDKDYEYTGVPKKMILNKDNTVSILMEGGLTGHLGDLAISQLADTTELAGYVIAKRQKVPPNINNEQFMSYSYINAPKGNYVILNDLASNFNKDEDEAKTKMMYASGTSAIAYKMANNNIERFFLFGEPDDKTNIFSYIEGADYNEPLKTYCTIIVERDGRQKQARMAWVIFD